MSMQFDIQAYILAAEGAPVADPAPAGAIQPTAAPTSPTVTNGELGPRRETPSSKPGGDEGWTNMIFLLVLMGVMMIFLFILPARARKKQQKKFDEMYKGLKRDDRIMLQNGKFVTVDKAEGDHIFVFADAARNVREEYHRNAVSMLASEVTTGDKK